ncbi:Glycosyltransferase [Polynucleobacter duraquae]|uniref:Glycosyltransferase n=1 Tax=Polynucleobacter duraquae TaxID=1835254 RepID=A0A0E3ZIS6_9BURK|nr:glycosyltransferase [Polynucleobacter duraquae]AKD24662.1 Glycosyltransferase [Polynucleobacter duraquae]
MTKKNILILVDYFYPGVRGVGPAKSIINFIDKIGDRARIKVFTWNWDIGGVSYSSKDKLKFLCDCNFECTYVNNYLFFLLNIFHIFSQNKFNKVILNSFFSLYFTLLPLLIAKVTKSQSKFFLAPRGELFSEVLDLKGKKKNFYINIVKFLNVYSKVTFIASNDIEANVIRLIFPFNEIIIIPDGINISQSNNARLHNKKAGVLKIVYLSRILKKKNLRYLIELLEKVTGNISLHIYGPIEERAYFNSCMQLAKEVSLHSNISIEYMGEVLAPNVIETFANYDLMILPTIGENFGHVISESLLAKTPVLISDRTPWISDGNNLVNVLSLDFPLRWVEIIKLFYEMDEDRYNDLVNNSNQYLASIHNNFEIEKFINV